ncbi:16S rRNA (adenine(1518)-N(6)/adenine(1519)-N(6))-dimethyltransferase RsmA [Pelomonas sp. CA6]|uniref:16S rRNA (adenine(1518)-N(6)/adenine(1519)-N(6))- dimethyltransferase RsmA n=1 Tax=Pelomonas sp. CA6 TaxID=2907999 RepID=UPI001F4C0452|nr:16S rRNA (adenine(1518)-N(6)/adenine(1519)-N(6))-dimethyltransferase RsmA [Pelomonas sp. CA6]MCH7343490.1 16S rRNA (adenine(1518)-N(6)/adenine(1519)-N(6))-dimethyltransferase RsmA [Pelomonas sp. CA6]
MSHVARKRFGQHFLTDRAVIDAIVDAIAPGDNESMVEIGPGLGAMTLPLLARLPASSQPLTVVELDRDLAARLRKRGDLNVVESDVLQVDFAALAAERGRKLRVVGNLPYNISSPILFHLLNFVDQVVDQHFMLQKEVVDRMAAEPGGKDYGRLSVMLQWRYDVEWLFDVPPEAFDPPPRVDSAIVRMLPRAEPAALDARLLSELVASAFSQRRKLLRHSLGRWLEARGYGGDFDLQRRAEEVPVQEFVALAQSLD